MKPKFQTYVKVENGKPVGQPTDMYSAHFLGEKQGLKMGEDGIPLCYEPFVPSHIPSDPVDWKKDHVRDTELTKTHEGYWTRGIQLVTKTKAEQKAYKAAATKKIKTELGYTSWTWDDFRGCYVAPIQPKPEDGAVWWFEEDQAWLPFTINDAGEYVKAE